jgi:hypothetical protein
LRCGTRDHMDAIVTNGCCAPGEPCGGGSRLSVIDYIERGLSRRRQPLLPISGEVRRDHERRIAQFSLQLEGLVVRSISFRSSACSTLIAFCEALSECATGLTLEAAGRVRPPQLVAALPAIPPYKRSCAVLAIAAFLSAVQNASGDL